MQGLKLVGIVVAACAAGLVMAPNTFAITASSTFDTDAAGWTGTHYGAGEAPTPFTPTYFSSGGDPGGWVGVNDPDNGPSEGLEFLFAPASYTGDASQNYNGTFSFDMYTNYAAARAPLAALFSQSAGTLQYSFPLPGNGIWAPHSVTLAEDQPGWVYAEPMDGSSTGSAPTQAQFLSVLADVDAVAILADLNATNGIPEQTGVDNVAMAEGTGPPPSEVVRQLTLNYSKRKDAFKGRLTLNDPSDTQACMRDQPVKVFKRDRGPDTRIGTDTTSDAGRYTVKDRGRRGTYYAKASRREVFPGPAGTDGVTCLPARSDTMRLGNNRRAKPAGEVVLDVRSLER